MNFKLSISQISAITLIPLLSATLLLSPAISVLTEKQIYSTLLIMAGMVLFATRAIPDFVTALLILTLAMLLEVAPAEVVFSGLSSTACWLIISGLVIGIAVSETGLAKRLGDRSTTYLNKSYLRLITGIVCLGVLFGFVMPSSVGRVFLFVPIAIAIANSCGFEKGSNGFIGTLLAAIFSCHIPTFAILTANIPNMIMMGTAETIYGWTPLFAEYLFLHFPVLGILKSLLLIALIMKFYPDRPEKCRHKPEHRQVNKREIQLSLIMLITLGFWLTDSIHHISAAWIALAAATVLLLPGVGMVSAKSFNENINLSSILVLAGLLGIASLINYCGISVIAGEKVLNWLPLGLDNDLVNFVSLTLGAVFTGIIGTIAGVSPALSPLAEQISQITGFSLEAVIMTQVFGFSTIVFPYQSVPLMMAMPLAGISMNHAARLCLWLAGLTIVVLLPVYYLWWQLLDWI